METGIALYLQLQCEVYDTTEKIMVEVAYLQITKFYSQTKTYK